MPENVDFPDLEYLYLLQKTLLENRDFSGLEYLDL